MLDVTVEKLGLVIGILSIVASLVGVALQLRRQWLMNSAAMVTQFVEKYDSTQVRRDRETMATMLLDHLDTGNGEMPEYAPVLGFFENIGFIARRGILDMEMLYNKFSFDLLRWHAALSREGNLIQAYRQRLDEPTIYCEVEWLCAAFSKLDRKRGKRGGRPVNMESVISFLEHEVRLSELQ